MDKKYLYDFYVSQIQDNFMPYWIKFFDNEKGGILNCINNNGDVKLSDNKFTWSQGRYLWVVSKLYELNLDGTFPELNNDVLLDHMNKTYEFIKKYSIYDDHICCYLLDREGRKLIDKKTNRYDASIFADCFVSLGMSEYIRVLKKEEELDVAKSLYKSIIDRIERNDFLTEPYPIPEGYVNHSIPMILLNTTFEYIKMLQKLGINYDEEVKRGNTYVEKILNGFYDNGLIREFISNDENFGKRLLDRHINPGHTLEDLWFLVEFLTEFGDLNKYLNQIILISQKTFNMGWDNEFGGLFRFVDKDGGAPKGVSGGSDYEKLILDTYDMKLWWPHSEILYVFLLLYDLSGNESMLENYKKSYEYVFNTFPNKEIGEWIQIRRRDGSPEEKLVALPVKDPFHIMRNFIKIVELTRGR